MKKLLLSAAVVIGFGALMASYPARAAVVLLEGGVADPNAGVVSAYAPTTISFDGGSGPLVPSTGSVLYTSGTTPYIAAAPYGDSTIYAGIGSSTLPQSAILTLASGVNYLGFYWGSVDTYNTLSLYDGNTLIATYTGGDVLNPANGYQGSTGSAYVNFFATGGDQITSVTFTSTQHAFEIDSITAAVPEPSTWALLTLGFVGLGFLGYRRSGGGVSFRVA